MTLRRFSVLFAFVAAMLMAAPTAFEIAQVDAKSTRSKSKSSAKKKSAKKSSAKKKSAKKSSAKKKSAKKSSAKKKSAKKKSAKKKSTKKKSTKKKRATKKKKRRRRGKRLVCRKVKGKRRCKKVARGYSGHGVANDSLRAEPLTKPSGEIWIYAVNFREEIKVNIYDENGAFDDAALAQLDHGFRCKRTHEARAVDPRLYETLSTIYDHFGKQRIDLISGFRFQKNEGSRHFHASAMDIRIEGVSTRELYDFAETLDTGGMGIGLYPRAGFVHVDWRAPGEKSYRWTDRSRSGTGAKGKSPSRAWRGKPNNS